ncbi:MAG: hypothetical protein Q9205_004460 [Flavoplaca limonia]
MDDGLAFANQRHSRNISYSNRTPLTRRITKGPLDVEDPIASSSTSQAPTSTTEAAAVPIPPTPSSTTTANPLSPTNPLAVRPSSRSSLLPSTATTKDLSFLLQPSNFHKISQTDIPPPFRSTPAAPGTPLPVLHREGNYYRTAFLAASSLITDSDLSPKQIFELLYVRLASLTLINQTPLAGKESLALGDIHSPFYLSDDTGECILPWELRVLAVRLQALEAGDAKRGVQGYYDLAFYARMRIRDSSDAEVKGLWKERLRDLGTRVGNTLVEMGVLEAGKRHFENLANATANAEEKKRLSSWVAMLCLRMGDLEAARAWTSSGDDDHEAGKTATEFLPPKKNDILSPFLAMTSGNYENAVSEWRALLNSPHAVLAKQNLAVCLLFTCHLPETTHLLSQLIASNHAFHALTFNLATVYELSMDKSWERKMQLAERVAEGLRRDRDEVEGRRMERGNVDFKL